MRPVIIYMNKMTCRHFYGKIPFEDYLELKNDDKDFCICDDLRPNAVRRAGSPRLREKEVINADQRTPIFGPKM